MTNQSSPGECSSPLSTQHMLLLLPHGANQITNKNCQRRPHRLPQLNHPICHDDLTVSLSLHFRSNDLHNDISL